MFCVKLVDGERFVEMEEIVYQLRSDRPFVRAAGDKWLAKLCLAVFVVVLVSVNGTSASNYEGWHAWEVVGTDNGWQNGKF